MRCFLRLVTIPPAARRALLAAALLAAPGALGAQLPGEPLNRPRMSVRGEFLAHTLAEVQEALAEWSVAMDRGQRRVVSRLLAPDVVFSPLEGWLARGSDAVDDAMAEFLPRISGYGLAINDFDASSSLAYVLGSIYYQHADRSGNPANRRVVTGLASIVLARAGSQWKIRSYVERPTTDP